MTIDEIAVFVGAAGAGSRSEAGRLPERPPCRAPKLRAVLDALEARLAFPG